MPEIVRLKENHICSRCHHKIKAGQKAKVYYYADKTMYRHSPICKGS